MNNQMTNAELTRLAHLSSAVVHGVDFPEQCDRDGAQKALVREMDRLEGMYDDSHLLFELRAAVLCRPLRKQALYAVTHDLVRAARDQQPRVSREARPTVPFTSGQLQQSGTPSSIPALLS